MSFVGVTMGAPYNKHPILDFGLCKPKNKSDTCTKPDTYTKPKVSQGKKINFISPIKKIFSNANRTRIPNVSKKHLDIISGREYVVPKYLPSYWEETIEGSEGSSKTTIDIGKTGLFSIKLLSEKKKEFEFDKVKVSLFLEKKDNHERIFFMKNMYMSTYKKVNELQYETNNIFDSLTLPIPFDKDMPLYFKNNTYDLILQLENFNGPFTILVGKCSESFNLGDQLTYRFKTHNYLTSKIKLKNNSNFEITAGFSDIGRDVEISEIYFNTDIVRVPCQGLIKEIRIYDDDDLVCLCSDSALDHITKNYDCADKCRIVFDAPITFEKPRLEIDFCSDLIEQSIMNRGGHGMPNNKIFDVSNVKIAIDIDVVSIEERVIDFYTAHNVSLESDDEDNNLSIIIESLEEDYDSSSYDDGDELVIDVEDDEDIEDDEDVDLVIGGEDELVIEPPGDDIVIGEAEVEVVAEVVEPQENKSWWPFF